MIFFFFPAEVESRLLLIETFPQLAIQLLKKGVSKRCEVTSVSIKDSSSTSKCCSCRRCCNLT